MKPRYASTRKLRSFIGRDPGCGIDPALLDPDALHELTPLVSGISDTALIRTSVGARYVGAGTVTELLDLNLGEFERLPESDRPE